MPGPSPPNPWTGDRASEVAPSKITCSVSEPILEPSKGVPPVRPLSRIRPWEREPYSSGHEANDVDTVRSRRSHSGWDRRFHQPDLDPYYSQGYSRHPNTPYYNNYSPPMNYGYPNGYGMYGCYNSDFGYGGVGRPLRWSGAAEKGYQWVNGFHSVTAGVGRFAGLLDANSQAMHGALSSIIRLAESACFLYNELGILVSGLTAFRLIQHIFRKLFYFTKQNEVQKSGSQSYWGGSGVSVDVQQFISDSTTPKRHRRWSILLFLATISLFGISFFHTNLRNMLEMRSGVGMDNTFDPHGYSTVPASPSQTSPILQVCAMYDYHRNSDVEIDLRKGDMIDVLDKPFESWWQGQVQGQPGVIGLFPSNFTAPLQPS